MPGGDRLQRAGGRRHQGACSSRWPGPLAGARRPRGTSGLPCLRPPPRTPPARSPRSPWPACPAARMACGAASARRTGRRWLRPAGRPGKPRRTGGQRGGFAAACGAGPGLTGLRSGPGRRAGLGGRRDGQGRRTGRAGLRHGWTGRTGPTGQRDGPTGRTGLAGQRDGPARWTGLAGLRDGSTCGAGLGGWTSVSPWSFWQLALRCRTEADPRCHGPRPTREAGSGHRSRRRPSRTSTADGPPPCRTSLTSVAETPQERV
jgi:hypothetical protein